MKPILYSVISCLFFFSCNKDRIAPDGFVSMDDFYERHKAEEQIFVIETDEEDCITGEKGTVVCPVRNDLTLNGDDVELPYNLHLTELYGAGDFILNRMPSIYTGGAVLHSPAMIDVATYKDEAGLALRNDRSMYVRLSSGGQPDDLTVFQTGQSGNEFDGWQDVSAFSEAIQIEGGFYEMLLANQTWSTAAAIRNETTTTVQFEIEASGTEHIQLYAIVSDYEGVIRGHDLAIEQVPLGTEIDIIAFAYDSDNQYQLYYTNRTLDGGATIELNFNVVSEEELLNFINGL